VLVARRRASGANCASSQNSPRGTRSSSSSDEVRPERLNESSRSCRLMNCSERWRSSSMPPGPFDPVLEDNTDGLGHSVAKYGTTGSTPMPSRYARVKNKRYTPAVRRLKDGDTASSVLAEFLRCPRRRRRVKASTRSRILRQASHAASGEQLRYVIPIIRWGRGDSARAVGRMESRHSAVIVRETRRSDRRASRLRRWNRNGKYDENGPRHGGR